MKAALLGWESAGRHLRTCRHLDDELGFSDLFTQYWSPVDTNTGL